MSGTKSFFEGQVVYFAEGCRPYGYNTQVGICEGVQDLSGAWYVDLIDVADYRYINGVHIDDFVSETEWRKLPKNWSYNTKLFEIENRVPEDDKDRLREMRLDNPADVLSGLGEGIICLKKDRFDGAIEAEIDRRKGWRIVKRHYSWTYMYGHKRATYARIPESDIFPDYASAKRRVDELQQERHDYYSMTDEEHSWNDLEQALTNLSLPDEEKKKYRDLFGLLPGIEDVEIKKDSGDIFFRYFRRDLKWLKLTDENVRSRISEFTPEELGWFRIEKALLPFTAGERAEYRRELRKLPSVATLNPKIENGKLIY